MGEPDAETPRRAPWHLWMVGGLALVWNLGGAVTIQMAQLGRLPDLTADELAYYAARSAWLLAATAVATWGSLAASALLLLRRRASVPMFDIALASVLIVNAVELWTGASRALANQGAAIATVAIVLIAIALPLYARRMRNGRILR